MVQHDINGGKRIICAIVGYSGIYDFLCLRGQTNAAPHAAFPAPALHTGNTDRGGNRRAGATKNDIMKKLILPFVMSLAFVHGAAAYDNVFDSDIFDNQTPNEEELEDDWSSQDTVGDMGQTTQTATTLLCAAAYLLYALYKKD